MDEWGTLGQRYHCDVRKKLCKKAQRSQSCLGRHQEIEHFCLIWQPIGVTISRRSAAGICADAQRLRQQCSERIA